MKSAGKARSNGLYRHIRTSKEIIRNLLNDYTKNLIKFSIDFPPVNSYLLFSTSVPAVDLDFSANLTYQFLEMGGKPF